MGGRRTVSSDEPVAERRVIRAHASDGESEGVRLPVREETEKGRDVDCVGGLGEGPVGGDRAPQERV